VKYNAYWNTVTWDTSPTGTAATGTGGPGVTGQYYGKVLWTYDAGTNYQFSTAMGIRNQGFDDGFVVGGAIGWNFGNGWRTELEVAYRKNDLSDGRATGGFSRDYYHWDGGTNLYTYATYSYHVKTYVGLNTVTRTGTIPMFSITGKTGTAKSHTSGTFSGTTSGQLETWSFMFNLWHDFNFGDSPLHPFVGAGIGFAEANLNFKMVGTGIANPYGIGGTTLSYAGNGEASDWGFAYQVGAGLGYDLGNGMMLSAQYRYFNTGEMDLSLADQISVNLESHNFLVGLNVPLGGGN
jgi:opacity protein-like surface antigen